MLRFITLLPVLALVAACAAEDPLSAPLSDLGAYRLGHNVVVASKAQKGPVSRDATPEEWQAVMRSAVQKRFGQYQGDQLYHFGISVEGYMLAPAGVPLLYKPKSALIINVTVWDDAANAKLNAEPKQFTIFESTTGESFVAGSGHSRSKEEQMAGLAANAMTQIEEWMVEQKEAEGWFVPRPGAATSVTVPADDVQTPVE